MTQEPATPWRRIGAYLLDYCLFIIPLLALLALAGWGLTTLKLSPFGDNPWVNQALGILALTAPVVLYFALSEASRLQATLGKRMMKVSVVDKSGRRANLKQTLMRAVGKLLPWECFHTMAWRWDGWPTNPSPPTSMQVIALSVIWLVIVWFLVCLFVGSRRTPYDFVADTVVVRTIEGGHGPA